MLEVEVNPRHVTLSESYLRYLGSFYAFHLPQHSSYSSSKKATKTGQKRSSVGNIPNSKNGHLKSSLSIMT